ncbi:hypothetical protein HYQ46_005622 [Verticillium longisporum]|nr:hypothetical protein HYQ46_005622 [Verticillium longisporum]
MTSSERPSLGRVRADQAAALQLPEGLAGPSNNEEEEDDVSKTTGKKENSIPKAHGHARAARHLGGENKKLEALFNRKIYRVATMLSGGTIGNVGADATGTALDFKLPQDLEPQSRWKARTATQAVKKMVGHGHYLDILALHMPRPCSAVSGVLQGFSSPNLPPASL